MDKVVRVRVVNKVVLVVTICRPAQKNAVNALTAQALFDAFSSFDANDSLRVAVLEGAEGTFCAGADLSSMNNPMEPLEKRNSLGPMGPSRLLLSKPVIAAVEGYCVAGGLELACWADLRVAATNSVFGVFCRKHGVPLIDGGTVRLPLLIGHSRAMDMILTGRSVSATEAFEWGLINRLCEPGRALDVAVNLALEIAMHPQVTMKADRKSVYEAVGKDTTSALKNEFVTGIETLSHAAEGAKAFINRKSKL